MKILLTGCNGQLGTDIRLVCEGEHEVIAHDLDLDITDRAAVASRLDEVRPDLVFNAAAYTDVDGAESDELTAFRVNALGVHNLALACQPAAVPLLHISTDFVFDGDSDRPYTEFDPPRPVSAYARSKYAGECYLTALLDRYYLCRTSWLFGTAGGNFVKNIMRAAGQNEVVRVVNDQEGSPTYSRDLAGKLIEIARSGAYGVYHVSNAGSCTWYEFTRQIFELAGIETPVEPITTEELGRPAARPRYSVMRGLAIRMQGIEPLRDYREALRQFILEDLPAWEARETAR